ncbi:TetR/AcrR family transcriptional regulator [Mycobacterium sp. NAZ190054]|uniref:TetR/AcrR family transcriptional regulator n=1 Tax=Mycobacterium sp. NAZ190054 TaxID=1747766 RepID=UPI00079CB187|nr:TetR/AcrR family transcriptional regulator [Mycobacterium sp. NAZ190054]KWX65915.1 TetR family transcriptional regulator [Mycobacterium sp. NAZ190054]
MTRAPSQGGRPRRSGIVADDPRGDILKAAAELFAARGFGSTRMDAIAERAGLGQSSLYYWFRSKDEILRGIMNQNRVSLEAARALAPRDEPAAVRLHIVLYQDVVQMCTAPLNFYDLEEAAKKQPEVFGDFQGDYAELSSLLRSIIAAGVTSGEFIDVSPEEFARTALCLNEGSQYRFHASSQSRTDVHAFADAAARTSLRAVMSDVDGLAAVQEAARVGIAGFSSSL